MAAPKRLACVVEGRGESGAVPALCARILHDLGVDSSRWVVQRDVIRQPRSQLVDESTPSPRRGIRDGVLARVSAIARLRDPAPDALLVLCDADDDCPAVWGSAIRAVSLHDLTLVGVMASREFESWLLWAYSEADRIRVKARDPELSPRDAKGALESLLGRYEPTKDQERLTRALDLKLVRDRSDSFDKLVRSLAALAEVVAPPRA